MEKIRETILSKDKELMKLGITLMTGTLPFKEWYDFLEGCREESREAIYVEYDWNFIIGWSTLYVWFYSTNEDFKIIHNGEDTDTTEQ